MDPAQYVPTSLAKGFCTSLSVLSWWLFFALAGTLDSLTHAALGAKPRDWRSRLLRPNCGTWWRLAVHPTQHCSVCAYTYSYIWHLLKWGQISIPTKLWLRVCVSIQPCAFAARLACPSTASYQPQPKQSWFRSGLSPWLRQFLRLAMGMPT